ncbi:MAG: hypothetical protein ACNS61_09025 [Candidatus Wenzhouxiangella sp. M2_3B_020]
MNTASKPGRPAVVGSMSAAICVLLVGAVTASPDYGSDYGSLARPVPASTPCDREMPADKVAAIHDRVSRTAPVRGSSAPDPAAEFVDDLGVWASTPWTVLFVRAGRDPGSETDGS